MINLAVLPYVPKTKDKCCCEDQGPPLDIPTEYCILSVILMLFVVIFAYSRDLFLKEQKDLILTAKNLI